jgi:cysteine synthase A
MFPIVERGLKGGCMRVFSNLSELVGNTPMLRLSKLGLKVPAQILLKLEYLNPLGSVKDRIAVNLIEHAEKKGALKPGMTIVEATNGNTGISLAAFCKSKGYKLLAVMPESMSTERRVLLLLLGAEVLLTPRELGLRGSLAKVHELTENNPDYYYINQGESEANPASHFKTADEIWSDTDGRVDMIVAGVGTGGTFRGLSQALKTKKKDLQMIGVEPAESAVLSGKAAGLHSIPGIGPGIFTPHLDGIPLDGVEAVSTEEAYEMSLRIIQNEGIPAGVSTGASVKAAVIRAQKNENEGKIIVCLATSSVERYLSTPMAEAYKQKALALTKTEVSQKYFESLQEFFDSRKTKK